MIQFIRPEDIILTASPHRWKEKRYSLGLLYVSSYLRAAGFDNTVVEYKFMGEGFRYKGRVESAQDLIQKIIEVKPKILGLTCMAPETRDVLAINNQVKEKIDVISIAGGHHATAVPEDFLKNNFDFVVVGEGEVTSVELMKELGKSNPDFSSILGLGWKNKNGEIIINQPRPLMDISNLLRPAYDQIKMERYVSMGHGIIRGVPIRCALVMSSRGCPYSCSFCCGNKVFGRQMRYRGYESIKNEIKYLRDEHEVEAIYFLDDTMTVNYDHVRRICQIMKDLGMYWGAQSRVDLTKEEIVKMMKDAGCLQLDFGVESGSQRILDEIANKRTNLVQVEKAFALCRKHGIRIMTSFMIGFPTETYEEMQQTLEFAKKLKANFYTLCALTPLPGTALTERFFKGEIMLQDYSALDFIQPDGRFNKSEVKNLNDILARWQMELREGLKWRNLTHPYFFIKLFWKLPHKKERINFFCFKIKRLLGYLFYKMTLRTYPY